MAMPSDEAVRVLYPPPGLTRGNAIPVEPPPGLEIPPPGLESFPGGSLLRMLATMDMPHNTETHEVPAQYPLKPPGVFTYDNLGYESTDVSPAASEAGDESDTAAADAAQMPNLVSMAGVVGVADAACKKASREMQVVPLGNADGQPCRVDWPADAKKLGGKDKQIVSPVFELFPGCLCRLLAKPRVGGEKSLLKGQAGLSKGKGWGYVEIKCVEGATSAPPLSFKLSVGEGMASEPITHDFKDSAVCTLQKQGAYLDFASAVDKETMTFLVSLEAVPIGAADSSDDSCIY